MVFAGEDRVPVGSKGSRGRTIGSLEASEWLYPQVVKEKAAGHLLVYCGKGKKLYTVYLDLGPIGTHRL